jgi:3D (Asp-Asp-Asp) domain-containing protein
MKTLATITAYCCCPICCGPHATGLAANGRPPVEGETCAGPRSLPLGTIVSIEGVGLRRVTDRTAKRFDGRFDIYFAEHQAAKAFGIREAWVEVQDQDR